MIQGYWSPVQPQVLTRIGNKEIWQQHSSGPIMIGNAGNMNLCDPSEVEEQENSILCDFISISSLDHLNIKKISGRMLQDSHWQQTH